MHFCYITLVHIITWLHYLNYTIALLNHYIIILKSGLCAGKWHLVRFIFKSSQSSTENEDSSMKNYDSSIENYDSSTRGAGLRDLRKHTCTPPPQLSTGEMMIFRWKMMTFVCNFRIWHPLAEALTRVFITSKVQWITGHRA